MIASGRVQLEEHATSFQIDPREQQSVALCAAWDPPLQAFVTECWQSRDFLCVSPGNESPLEQSGLVGLDPPYLWNALIGCGATLTNLSQQMNGLQWAPKQWQRLQEMDKMQHLCPDEAGNGGW